MKYLGVDLGLKRVGLAISEGELASPLQTIEVSGLASLLNQIQQKVNEEKIDVVVIGQPEGVMGKNAQSVAKKLKELGIEVELVDETLSTQKARDLMLEMGASQKSRRDDNAVSAAIILQGYLDQI